MKRVSLVSEEAAEILSRLDPHFDPTDTDEILASLFGSFKLYNGLVSRVKYIKQQLEEVSKYISIDSDSRDGLAKLGRVVEILRRGVSDRSLSSPSDTRRILLSLGDLRVVCRTVPYRLEYHANLLDKAEDQLKKSVDRLPNVSSYRTTKEEKDHSRELDIYSAHELMVKRSVLSEKDVPLATSAVIFYCRVVDKNIRELTNTFGRLGSPISEYLFGGSVEDFSELFHSIEKEAKRAESAIGSANGRNTANLLSPVYRKLNELCEKRKDIETNCEILMENIDVFLRRVE